MAKMVFKENVFTHDITGDGTMVASLDLNAVFPSIISAGGVAVEALQFAVKTASRNATAGLLDSTKPAFNPAEAFKRVQARMTAWAGGKWLAASESSGEPRTSLLARAVAEVMGITAEQAAEDITAAIDAALDEANLSKDEESDKAQVRKIGNAIRGAIREADDVKVVYARMKAEDATKNSEAVAAAPKAGKGVAELLKK